MGDETSNLTDEDYLKSVHFAKKHCFRGDVFQLVLSRRFEQKFRGDEFNVYRALRNINPSPYLFFFDYGDYKPVSYTHLSDDQADSFTSTLLQVNNEQPFDFASHTLDLSAYKGKSIYIAFVNNTNNGTYLALDDLYLSKSANCTMPDLNGFGVVNLKPTSFSINWSSTEGISQYDTDGYKRQITVISPT